MAKLNDLTNQVFGNWKVLYRNGSTLNKASVWRCKCLLCGQEKDVAGYSLTSGASTKCRRCVPKETLSKPHRKDRIYNIYNGMMQRCTNPKHKSYDDYGGRGISVCAEWFRKPDAFIEWANSSGYTDGMTIERIDPNGDYCPDNCCWLPLSEQSRNRRANTYVLYHGQSLCLAEACRISGANYETVRSYRRRHKDISWQEAFDRIV